MEDRSNATLERFLRARRYDVPLSAAMFVEHRCWRASFGWAQGARDVPTQLAQRKVCMQGLCRDGLPFVLVVARAHVPTGAAGVPELHRFFVYVMDTISTAMCVVVRSVRSAPHAPALGCVRSSALVWRVRLLTEVRVRHALCSHATIPPRRGPAGMFRILVDLRGMSRHNADLAAMKVAFGVLQKGFPERMAHLWLAEPPGVFHALWRLMSPFVAPGTHDKIGFVAGRDVARVLGVHVDAALLPADWGGSGALRPLSDGPAIWQPQHGEQPRRRY